MATSRRLAVTRHTVDGLTPLGLGGARGQVYFLVLTSPHSTPASIGERTGLPLPDVETILHELVAAGQIVRVSGHEARYRAVSPQAALRNSLAETMRAADAARRAVGHLEEVFRETVPTSDPAARIEIVYGPDNYLARGRQLVEEAGTQVRTLDRPPYAMDVDTADRGRYVQVATGVLQRTIYDREALTMPGRLDANADYSRQTGEVARVLRSLPVKALISDDRAALMPVSTNASATDVAYVVHQSTLLTALIALFETLWVQAVPMAHDIAAEPIGPEESTGGGAPDGNARVLLDLLLAGHTDGSIATVLGQSPRTVQRRVRDLLDQLGAHTRFQAGAAAVLRGWI